MHLTDCQNVVGKGQGVPQPINNKKMFIEKNVVRKGQGLPQPVHSQKCCREGSACSYFFKIKIQVSH